MEMQIVSPVSGVLEENYMRESEFVILDQSIGIVRAEDDKLSLIQCHYEGRIKKVLVAKGETAAEGMILAIIEVA
ncbi:hypothetical protein [Ferviditalea candida]|uniref:Lipoyl-binding domain-containing protein n=1 Tax=Ferviditalea candida TaxID=3108399 RepID=A0ABU5ZGA5_9BACL|nr:hypothetical protein [Paenibacillaceae bacterium T2]